jgi:hypothetical protein
MPRPRADAPTPPRLQGKSQADVEKEQELMLMKKYGGLKPKKKLLQQVRSRFVLGEGRRRGMGAPATPTCEAGSSMRAPTPRSPFHSCGGDCGYCCSPMAALNHQGAVARSANHAARAR